MTCRTEAQVCLTRQCFVCMFEFFISYILYLYRSVHFHVCLISCSHGYQCPQSASILTTSDGPGPTSQHAHPAGAAQSDEGQEDHLAGDPGVAGEDEGRGTPNPQGQPTAAVPPLYRPGRPRHVCRVLGDECFISVLIVYVLLIVQEQLLSYLKP